MKVFTPAISQSRQRPARCCLNFPSFKPKNQMLCGPMESRQRIKFAKAVKQFMFQTCYSSSSCFLLWCTARTKLAYSGQAEILNGRSSEKSHSKNIYSRLHNGLSYSSVHHTAATNLGNIL